MFSKHGRLSIKLFSWSARRLKSGYENITFFLYHVSGPLVKRRIKRQIKECLIKTLEALDRLAQLK
ncbi:MAG: hypothetical protein C4548_06365 [Desulfobacteraceae bacterium]|nr:MAG: hypothetical protein C4548_06365 [Desulfobacteraceae bacterium]